MYRYIINLFKKIICALSCSIAKINVGIYFVPAVEISVCSAHLAKPDGVFLYLPRAISDELTRTD